jgi:hypothetical protein
LLLLLLLLLLRDLQETFLLSLCIGIRVRPVRNTPPW